MAVTAEQLADEMFEMVREYQGKKKFKAGDLTKAMMKKYGDEVDKKQCKMGIRVLMDSGRCVYTYFGGSFIEMPRVEGAAEVKEDAPKVVDAGPAPGFAAGGAGSFRKKKKKKKFRSGPGMSSTGKKELSPLRPLHAEKVPPCRNACPSGNRVREFVTAIARAEKYGRSTEEGYTDAWNIYTETSPFPAVCGRVCPHPCETGCNRNEVDAPVNINQVERTIGDFGLRQNLPLKKLTDETKSEKIVVVGAGPGGLSCAYHLARLGYPVTVLEAAEKAGGMLLWGIPRYRLPADVLAGEVKKITDLGVEIQYKVKVGKDVSLDDLRRQYHAVFVSIGAQQGLKLRVEGEDAENVISGVDFLNKIHHGESVEIGKKVIVIGGGDTAIDAARISKRLGADVTILYRRTRAEMPAIEPEIVEAEEEGVKIEFLAAPVGFVKDGDRIEKMKCIRMELGEPDASGRRRPVPVEGSDFEVEATTVIPAISQRPDFTGFDCIYDEKDWIKVDEDGRSVKAENVYAGGDFVKLALVTTAIGQGRRAAEAIDASVRGEKTPAFLPEQPIIEPGKMRLDHYEKKERSTPSHKDPAARVAEMEAEVSDGITVEAALDESKRCMSCGHCFDCEKCWMFCQDQAIEKGSGGALYTFKMENCTGCKKCAEECPCGFIDMK